MSNEYIELNDFFVNLAKKSIKKVDVDEFVENHKYINYCEAIIYRDGRISYVRPSHIRTLIAETGMSEEKVYELMPMDASPIEWLVDYTGCVAVWYDFIKTPGNITEEQIESIKKLVENEIINVSKAKK